MPNGTAGLALAPVTFASQACERLRQDIISGHLPPGQKLHIGQLCESYGIGLSPIREALNRLSRRGLVIQADQRGFRVAPVSIEHLAELTRTRCWLYDIGLRESIAHGDERWEEQIVLAYHRLYRLDQRAAHGEMPMRDPQREEAHRTFHASLIAACRSQWLMGFCEQLFDAAERYRNLARFAPSWQPPQDEHKAIMEAAVSRNADLACRLLTDHARTTSARVHDGLNVHPSALGARAS